MNKTIIININGIVFHIEEDAYELLRVYMTEVKRHFAYTPDSTEIVTDIEDRLAEMFNERLARDGKQVIVLLDVQEVTAQMGSATDFDLQEEDTAEYAGGGRIMKEKLWRDMDDKMIGGVCAGLGHFFNIEARWVRLFALLILLFFGTGLFIYIILWIVVPVARTRTEKMAMKGEPINIQNFKKNFDEEIENLKQGFNRAGREAEPIIGKIGDFLGALFRIILKIIGIIIIIAGVSALVALIVGLVMFYGDGNIGPFPRNMIDPQYVSVISFSAFVVAVIPIIALILFAMRVLFNRSMIGRYGSFAMLIIWLTGVSLAAYYGTKIGMQFQERAAFSQNIPLKPDSLYLLRLSPEKYLSKQDSIDYDIDPSDFKGRTIINNRHNINFLDRINLQIEKADTNRPYLVQEYSARGQDFESSLKTARQIRYQVKQTDSLLLFDQVMYLGKNALMRDQEVNMILRIPLNTRLMIDGDLNSFLEINLWDCREENSPDETPSEWIMTDEGLKCVNDSLYRKRSEE